MNATKLAIEKGYPERTELSGQYTSWDAAIPDSVQYGSPVTNNSVGHGTVVEKLQRKGLDVRTEKEIIDLSRMSYSDVVIHYGSDFAEQLQDLRCPLGRTGLNGVGIFYEAGESLASDMVVVHTDERSVWVPLVFNRTRWNTPGGFKDLSDTNGEETAVREFSEEVGYDISSHIIPVIQEVKSSDRTTDHGWMKVEVYATRAESKFTLTAGDDAEKAMWAPLELLPNLVRNNELSQTKLDYIKNAVKLLDIN